MTEKKGITAAGIRAALGPLGRVIEVEVLEQCASTNTLLRERADDLPAWHAVIAKRQTGGRGRLGRRFYSPEGTGLYLSVLLRPDLPPEELTSVTPAAAVAVCRALEELGAERCAIKWVNDVYIRGKKVCGILTEAGPGLQYAVVGVGINVTEPEGGFPADIAGVAGAVFPRSRGELRETVAAAFLRHFYEICAALPGGPAEEYRERSFLVGRTVDVVRGDVVRRARVLAVDGQYRLLVRYEDTGGEEALFSGEVSIRPGDM